MEPRYHICLGILLMGLGELTPVHAFYNPSTGRWLTRDPIEERGGQGLYVHNGNAAPASVDPVGLAWQLTLKYDYNVPYSLTGGHVALMQRPDYPADPAGRDALCGRDQMVFKGYKLKARLFVWFVQNLPDTLLPYPTQRSSPWAHEQRHVDYYKVYYTAVDQAYSQLEGQCVCRVCYDAWKGYVEAAKTYFFDLNEMVNARWDISEYLIPAAAQDARNRLAAVQAIFPQDLRDYTSASLDFQMKCAGYGR